MHHYLWEYDNDVIEHEEDIITKAENETYEVYDIIKPFLGKVVKDAVTVKPE